MPGAKPFLSRTIQRGFGVSTVGLVVHLRRARLHGHLLAVVGVEDELVVVELLGVVRRCVGEAGELRLQVVVVDVGDRRELELIDRRRLHRHRGDDPERAEADHGRVEDVVVADQLGADPRGELLVQHRLRRPLDPQRLAAARGDVQAHDEVGHRPEVDLRAVGVPGDRAGDRLAVADAGGLDRAPAGALPLRPLEVGVELGDLHSGLGEDDVAALRGRIGGIEVRLADVVATVQQLGVHQPAVGDVDLRQRPARADREDALAGVAGLADQPVEGLARH